MIMSYEPMRYDAKDPLKVKCARLDAMPAVRNLTNLVPMNAVLAAQDLECGRGKAERLP